MQKEVPEILINGKDTVPVCAGDKFEGHACRAFLTVFHSAGRAKSGVATEGNKLKVSAVWACIHGTAEGRVATVDHLGDVFHFNISGMKRILNNFVVVFKNLLKDVHKMIMKEMGQKNNPLPLKSEGQGS